MRLNDLQYLDLDFNVRPTRPYILPPWPGAMMRGAIGNQLRNIVCKRFIEDCKKCDIKSDCLFTEVFEPLSDGKGPLNPVAPFVLGWNRGEDFFDFKIRLFGTALRHYRLFIFATSLAVRSGLGKERIRSTVTPDALDIIYENGYIKKETQNLKEVIERRIKEFEKGSIGRVRLRFHTPLRIVENGRLIKEHDLSFLHIYKSIKRRLKLLMMFYTPTNKEKIIETIDQNEITEARIENRWLSWIDIKRRSSRQKRLLTTGGLIGHIIVDNLKKSDLELLFASEIIHIGKMATFGFGKVEVEKI